MAFTSTLPVLSHAKPINNTNYDCLMIERNDIMATEVSPTFRQLGIHIQGTGGKWVYQGKTSKKVTWKQGSAVSHVASLITSLAPFAGTTGIIASIGLNAIAIMASNAIGGTLTYKMYLYDYLGVQKVKYVWTFKDSTGITHGPYTTIISNN